MSSRNFRIFDHFQSTNWRRSLFTIKVVRNRKLTIRKCVSVSTVRLEDQEFEEFYYLQWWEYQQQQTHYNYEITKFYFYVGTWIRTNADMP